MDSDNNYQLEDEQLEDGQIENHQFGSGGEAAKQALAGIKVLDLSRVLAGPSCTQILADLGAEVIKVERPDVGDETRHWTPPTFDDSSENSSADREEACSSNKATPNKTIPNKGSANKGSSNKGTYNNATHKKGTSAYFATVNRNKQSITIDITRPEGQALIKRLAADSDVLVENFKVGGLKKYGLDYESLKSLNPRLIYASLTGFGQTGPDAHKPGYDYIIQGQSGLMSITGPADGEPHKVGVAVVDLFAGLQLTIGIQAALLARQHSGVGQHVDVALLDSAIAMLANIGMNQLASNTTPPRLGNAHPNITPYQVFETSDKQHFILACGNDEQFAKICEILNLDLHLDNRYVTNPSRVVNRDALTAILTAVFISNTREHWLETLQSASIPCGPIHNVTEALAMPQVQARDMVVGFSDSPIRVLGNPIKLSATPVQYKSPPPQLGAQTQETLSKLGLTEAEIAHLKAQKVT